jgi:hypothetical protein
MRIHMSFYRINKSRIVYEMLNTEVIVIDFNTGNYFALIHVAKLVWQFLEQEVSMQKMVQILSNAFRCEPDIIANDLKVFFDELLQNGLIEEGSEISAGMANEFNIDGWVYDPPKLEKYSDVQNLLLLDPIHEVADGGWPEKLH